MKYNVGGEVRETTSRWRDRGWGISKIENFDRDGEKERIFSGRKTAEGKLRKRLGKWNNKERVYGTVRSGEKV